MKLPVNVVDVLMARDAGSAARQRRRQPGPASDAETRPTVCRYCGHNLGDVPVDRHELCSMCGRFTRGGSVRDV
jgi:hypothetical protein